MQQTVWDQPFAEELNMSPSNNCCLILKRLIDSPSVLVGGVDNVSLIFINFSESSAFLSVVKTSKNISTSEVKQPKWPNLRTTELLIKQVSRLSTNFKYVRDQFF